MHFERRANLTRPPFFCSNDNWDNFDNNYLKKCIFACGKEGRGSRVEGRGARE